MSSTETDLLEAQDDLESYRLQEVDLLESLNSQKESLSSIEPLSLSDVKLIEPFDLEEQFILEKYKQDLAKSSKWENDEKASNSLKSPGASYDRITNSVNIFDAISDLQDPLSINSVTPSLKDNGPDSFEWDSIKYEKNDNASYSVTSPDAPYDHIQKSVDILESITDLEDPLSIDSIPLSPKGDGPDSLEWDPLLEPPILSEEDVRDTVIIQNNIENLSSLKTEDPLDTHGFEWDHIDEQITFLHDEQIQQPISLQQTYPEQSNHTYDTHGPLSLPEYSSDRYSPSLDLRKFTLDLNDDDNGPNEYYGPQSSYSDTYSSLNTSMRPKIVHKSNKLKKYDHYLVEFDDDEVVVQKCNTMDNNGDNSENSLMQKYKTEKKRRSLSRKAKMYVQNENLKRGENVVTCKNIPEIVDISKSSDNPKKTKVMIKGLESMKKSDIEGVLGHLNNYITDNAISTALNEHTYFTKRKTIPTKGFSNIAFSDIQLNILRQTLLQAGLLSLNEFLDQGVLDITNHATVQLGQILTFSLYFNKNIREIANSAWQSQPMACLTDTVQDIAHEVAPHLTVGTCLVALSDQTEGSSLDETWVGLGCLALTYLYQVARKSKKAKESNHKIEK